MLQWTLLLSALVFANSAAANPTAVGKPTESQATCIECMRATNTSNDSLKRFVMEMKKITEGAVDIKLISDKMNYNNKCDKFAGDGELNKWGMVITQEISKPKYATLLNEGSKDIGKYCPNFDNMKVEQKKALNVLILTAMAHYESSCDFKEKAPGPNGTAAGLLQLHKGREHIYSSGCRKGDSATAEKSLVCGLSMINDQIERGENLFSSRSYWEVLRPAGRSKKAKRIMAAIRKFPPCTEKVAANESPKNPSYAFLDK